MTSDAPAADVCAVVVTYADRFELCSRAVSGAITAGAAHVVVVDNGSQEPSGSALAEFAGARTSTVTLVRLPANAGSAVGFRTGLVAAVTRIAARDIWLLDDDNVPRPQALRELLTARARLERDSANRAAGVLVTAFRSSNKIHNAIVGGMAPTDVFPSRGAFMNVSMTDIPAKLRRRRRSRTDGTSMPAPTVSTPQRLPYGPYGGLLLPRTLVEAVGYPREDYVTYEDDAEYTRRLVESGALLYLVPSAVVDDLEQNWYRSAAGANPFTRALMADSSLRVFYSFRNRVAFEREYWSGPRWLRFLNRNGYLVALAVAQAVTGRRQRYRLIRRAIHDGEAGMMGVVRNLT